MKKSKIEDITKIEDMTKEELLELNRQLTIQLANAINEDRLLNKKDIMSILQCKDGKARDVLSYLFQTNQATKIGKETYVCKKDFYGFVKAMRGKEVYV